MSRFTVLVCGSREWSDGRAIREALEPYALRYGAALDVVHGDARGADRTADVVARALGLSVRAFPADWRGKGRAAGLIRNRVMLRQEPRVVLAFKDGFDYEFTRGGTEHMVRIAIEACVPCVVYDRGTVNTYHGDSADLIAPASVTYEGLPS